MASMDKFLTVLRAAGEKTRLRLLFVLSHGELNVKELTQILGQSQPRISRHLKLLCEADLLERHREGSWVLFRLADDLQAGRLARLIVDHVPADDTAVLRDLSRLETVRETRRRQAAEYFNEHAGDWDTIRSLHIDEADVEQAMTEVLGGDPLGDMLDLGTGTGRMLELFAENADSAVGIDSSQQMLSYARANLERRGFGHCQVRHGDLYNLPYDSGSRDVVIFHQVLHFLDDPLAAILEAARVLKAGGRMMIVDFAPHELEFLREQHAHRRLGISENLMEGWFAEAGLSLVRRTALPPSGASQGEGLTVTLWLSVLSGETHTLQQLTQRSDIEDVQ